MICTERLSLNFSRSGAKKPPTPVGFDTSDPLHVEFIIASAIVRAMCFGVDYSAADDIPRCMSIAVNTPVEIFK